MRLHWFFRRAIVKRIAFLVFVLIFIISAAYAIAEDSVIDCFLDGYYYYENPLSFAIESDGKWGFYDKASGFLLRPCYDEVYDASCTVPSSPVLVAIGDDYGYVDRSNGEVVIPLQYDYCGECSEFVNGYAVVGKRTDDEKNSSEILIDTKGHEIIFPDGYSPCSYVYNETVVICRYTEIADGTIYAIYGLGNVQGEVVLLPQYDYISNFYEGYASVKKNDLWGHIDVSGNVIVPPTYALDEEICGSEGYYFENGIAELLLSDDSVIYIDYAGRQVDVAMHCLE